MNWSYFFMIAALVCYGMLGVFAKIADDRGCRPRSLYLLLFFWACLFVCGFVIFGEHANFSIPVKVYWIALPFGMLAAVAGLAFQTGIHYGKISTSWLIINLSAIVPAVCSILIYHERLTLKIVLVLLLTGLSIYLLWQDKKVEEQLARRTTSNNQVNLGN
jgi:drug/metabolite transporter (DMT)-like permease